MSQQLALVGVCANCGAHQLTSVPTGGTGLASNATSTSATSFGTKAVATQGVGESSFKSSSRAGPVGCGNSVIKLPTTSTIHTQRQWRGQNQLESRINRNNITSNMSDVTRAGNACEGAQHRSELDQGRVGGKAGSSQCSFSPDSKSSMATAKVLHSKIGAHDYDRNTTQIGRVNACIDIGQRQTPRTGLVVTNSCLRKRQQIASMSRLNELTSSTGADQICNDQSMSSLANDSFMDTSLDGAHTYHTNGSLAREHSSHHRQKNKLSSAALISSAADQIGSASGGDTAYYTHQMGVCSAQCLSEQEVNTKGSDTMLCNQSVLSTDYCSDCCASLCHCSCPVCSSNGGDESDAAPCVHAHQSSLQKHASSVDCATGDASSPHDSNEADDDNDDGDHADSLADNSVDYDAMCILQLVHHDNNASGGKRPGASRAPESLKCSANRTRAICSNATLIRRRKSDNSSVMHSLESGASHPGHSSNSFEALLGFKATGGESGQGRLRGSARRSQTAMEMRTLVKYNYHNEKADDGDDDEDNEDERELLAVASTAPVTSSAKFTPGGKSLPDRPDAPQVCSDEKLRQTGASVAFALRAAATSALGATLSDEVTSSDPQGGLATTSPFVHAIGDTEKQTAAKTTTSTSGTGCGGAIRASLEMVRQSDEARRKNIASNRQRRKSGCFNYHDEYEYSYGLVESQSDSECEHYYYDNDDGKGDDGPSQAFDMKFNSIKRRGKREGTRASANASNVSARDGADCGDNYQDYYDDDDFEHDGRMTLERKSSSSATNTTMQQAKTANKRFDSLSSSVRQQQQRQSKLICQSPLTKTHHGKTPTHQAISASSACGAAAADRPAKELEFDEHRINSLALITATLSAGGAIVDSSGSSIGPSKNVGEQQQTPHDRTSSSNVASQLGTMDLVGSGSNATSTQGHRQK